MSCNSRKIATILDLFRLIRVFEMHESMKSNNQETIKSCNKLCSMTIDDAWLIRVINHHQLSSIIDFYCFQNDMAGEPDFCRDILETRIKGILKEHLKISRDISFLQVQPK